MEEMMVRPENRPAILEGYVQQGKMFLFNAAQNLIQYGRVLTEAKQYVPHGQFGNWVAENFGMSERSAQGYMAVWKRFGKNEQLNGIQFSSLQKMLSLPEGTENQFAAEHKLSDMTAREVERAVKKVREEARAEIEKEKNARILAEQRIMEAKNSYRDNDRAEMEVLRNRAEVLKKERDEALEGQEVARKAENKARFELQELELALEENQQEYSRLQSELLNAKSAMARGDAERVISEQFTVEDFSSAVRIFLGATAQMPYMGGTFSQMVEGGELRQWDELLSAVEDWDARARKALNTVNERGV